MTLNRKTRRDRLGTYCDINCTVILRYSFALRIITFSSCVAAVLKVMDQNIPVKPSDVVIRYVTLCINKHLESLPDTSSLTNLSLETICQTLFYEGISMTKFNNLKAKSVQSNLKYTESKLVKKDHGKRKKF